MPLLRFQQPCPCAGDRRGTLRPGVPLGAVASRQADQGAQSRLHLLWRRHALADEARHGRRHSRCHRRQLDDRTRRRGHAGGQPDQCRGEPLHRLQEGRREPSLARRPGDERRGSEGAGPSPHSRGGDEGGGHRRLDLRALLIRPYLRPAEPDAGRLESRTRAGARAHARSHVAVPVDDRARHDVRTPAQRRQVEGAQCRPVPRPLGRDAGDDGPRRPARLRDFQPCAPRRREPA